jgi:hypothetical protein
VVSIAQQDQERVLESYKLASEMAFQWFSIHAEQRLKLLNFFLLIAGFCIAGFFAALQAKNHLAASVVSILLVCMSYLFKQLDRRTSQLIKHAEDYLKESLGSVSSELKSQAANFVSRAEQKDGLWSYRQIFNILFFLFGALGLLGAIFSWLQRLCL